MSWIAIVGIRVLLHMRRTPTEMKTISEYTKYELYNAYLDTFSALDCFPSCADNILAAGNHSDSSCSKDLVELLWTEQGPVKA